MQRKCFAGSYFVIVLVLAAVSCTTVKPYQRVYLNDEAMQSGKKSLEKFSNSVHSYREAATGGGSGKSSGGCGCN